MFLNGMSFLFVFNVMFPKKKVQIKMFCKRCIYISHGLWNCLVGLIFFFFVTWAFMVGLILRLDVCVIVVCMLVYK